MILIFLFLNKPGAIYGEAITSAQNNRIKQANKLKKKRERDKTGLALIEGVHLIEEAYQSGIVITQLLQLNRRLILANYRIRARSF